MSEPVMTLRWLMDGEEDEDRIKVYWTAPTEDGHASLMSVPDEPGYVIAQHERPFTDGQAIDYESLDAYFVLGRPEAGRFAVALITALIDNSDQIINSYIEERMARR
jgi:hypothetical protein